MRLENVRYEVVARWCFVRLVLLLLSCSHTQPACCQSLSIDTNRAVETIHERYDNRRVKIERQVTLDDQGNYVNHGQWRQWDPSGTLVAEGQYDMGQPVGLWTCRHTAESAPLLAEQPFCEFQGPFISQATFTAGKLDGDWVIFAASGQKCSLISFKGGLRDGKAIRYLPGDVVLREASYRQGAIDGELLVRDSDGKLQCVATYDRGRQTITKLSYLPGTTTKTAEAHFLAAPTVERSSDDFWQLRFAAYETLGDEQRHGPYRLWYPDGQLQLEGNFRNDLETGTFTWWHANGQKAVEGRFNAGRQQGTWTWWHPNGIKATLGQFDHGQQTGQWREWQANGILAGTTSYDPSGTATARQSGVSPSIR